MKTPYEVMEGVLCHYVILYYSKVRSPPYCSAFTSRFAPELCTYTVFEQDKDDVTIRIRQHNRLYLITSIYLSIYNLKFSFR